MSHQSHKLPLITALCEVIFNSTVLSILSICLFTNNYCQELLGDGDTVTYTAGQALAPVWLLFHNSGDGKETDNKPVNNKQTVFPDRKDSKTK